MTTKQVFNYWKKQLFVKTLLNIFYGYKGRERNVSYGKENSDKTFYIIGQNDKSGGLWWLINKALMHIGYATDHGYIPLVDMQNFQSQYLDKDLFQKENAWEYYFEQPMKYKLENIRRSKNVILSKQTPSPNEYYFMGDFYSDLKKIEYFKDLFKKYIVFNSKTQTYLEGEYKQILEGKGKVLGVLCRGTDYLLNKPSNHPIQPEPVNVIEKAEKIMEKTGCLYLYLSTEDEVIYQQFKIKFGEKLLTNKQNRIDREDMKNVTWVSSVREKENRNKYLSGLEYLSSTYLLSRCTCFLSGRTGGAKGVLLLTKGFEYQYIYNLGYYP